MLKKYTQQLIVSVQTNLGTQPVNFGRRFLNSGRKFVRLFTRRGPIESAAAAAKSTPKIDETHLRDGCVRFLIPTGCAVGLFYANFERDAERTIQTADILFVLIWFLVEWVVCSGWWRSGAT